MSAAGAANDEMAAVAAAAVAVVVNNPYKAAPEAHRRHSKHQPQKQPPLLFVGGAEAARRKARRRPPPTRIVCPQQQQQQQQSSTMTKRTKNHHNQQQQPLITDPLLLSPRMVNVFERFFAALLRSAPSDFVAAALADTTVNQHNRKNNTNAKQNNSAKTKKEEGTQYNNNYNTNTKNDATANCCPSHALWSVACRRVGVPLPDGQPIPALCSSPATHFGLRAAVVLEEARCAIAQSLLLLSQHPNHHANGGSSTLSSSSTVFPGLRVQCVDACNPHGHFKVTFGSRGGDFTAAQLYNLRPGAIAYYTSSRSASSVAVAMMGVVVTGSNNNNNNSTSHPNPKNNNNNASNPTAARSFSCLFFRETDWSILTDLQYQQQPTLGDACTTGSGSSTQLVILTQLVTHWRAFEAMSAATTNHLNPTFVAALMGMKQQPQRGTHTRFLENTNKNSSRMEENGKNDTEGESWSPATKTIAKETSSPHFCIPPLNRVQESAATSFLQSPPHSITLVQGPPGTGKTTLLVATICRYVSQAMERGEECRLMVSAPTNQAVSVLATRFLATMRHAPPPDMTSSGAAPGTYCKTILVGDADKLLNNNSRSFGEPRGRQEFCKDTERLQSIFLYKWIPAVVEGYERIRSLFAKRSTGYKKSDDTVAILHDLAEALHLRLTCSLRHLSSDVIQLTKDIAAALGAVRHNKENGNSNNSSVGSSIVHKTEKLLSILKEMPSDAVWTQLLLTANVIFCTLASAGGAVLKKTSHIDDLIVDEAAATTEPELCIPFHLRPKRLLAVGDPLQLPATVLSRRAMDLGLDKSLHERLMYDCDFEHVMLNVQYRMNSQISAFPSARFYNSKIDNGSNVAGPLYLNGARLLDRLPYSFLQVEGTEEQGFGGSFCNKSEAKKVVDVIVQLQQMAQDASWSSAERIRVITFYQAQVSLIKKYLHDRGFGNKIVVATVDSSQGSEADVVILSFVRSPKIISEHQHGRRPNSNPRSSAGFLSDDRRMNVALTRAKYQLICVGNVHGFSRLALNCTNNENTTSTTTLCELALDAEQREVIRTPLLSSVDNVNERLDIFYGMTSSAQASKRVFS